MNAYISLLDGWVRLVGRGNGKYGEEGDFFYSLVLSHGAADGRRKLWSTVQFSCLAP